MSLSSNEQKQIIKRLTEHTAIAEYAFKDALKKQTLSSEDLLFLMKHLEIISVLKPVVKANRNGQRASSTKNNEKYRKQAKSANIKVQELEQENFTLKQKIENLLQDLLDVEASEIYQLGQWLKNALAQTGRLRDETLLEKKLVHKDFYNGKIEEAELESIRRDESDRKTETEYKSMVNDFELRIDYLRKVSEKSEQFIKRNHGTDIWNDLIA